MTGNVFDEFIRLFCNRHVVMVVGGVYFLLRIFNTIQPIGRSSLYRRLLPFLPEILSYAAILLGSIPELREEHWVIKGAAALWCGYAAQRFHKILGQTILGDDPRIPIKNTSTCSYCDGPIYPEDVRCRTCGAATFRALSVAPPPMPEE